MHPTATRHDFHNLPQGMQDKYENVLNALQQSELSCRCEMVGKDFTIIVAPGMSPANYWLKRFDLLPTNLKIAHHA